MNRIIAYKSIMHNNVTNCTFIATDLDEEVQIGTRENDKHIEWVGDLDVEIPNVKKILRNLFQEIKHGDKEHQDWLENKIESFIKEKGFLYGE